MGVDTIINKKLSAASHIYTFTMKAEVASIKCLTGSDAEVLEFIVHSNALVTQKILKEIDFPKGAIIGGVVRGHKSFIANGETLIKAGDKVVVFALPPAIFEVEKYFN
jgi:trk system potassium uptake protein TrkA